MQPRVYRLNCHVPITNFYARKIMFCRLVSNKYSSRSTMVRARTRKLHHKSYGFWQKESFSARRAKEGDKMLPGYVGLFRQCRRAQSAFRSPRQKIKMCSLISNGPETMICAFLLIFWGALTLALCAHSLPLRSPICPKYNQNLRSHRPRKSKEETFD